MTDEKKATTFEDSAAQAERLEASARSEADSGTYTHVFKRPFTHGGVTYEHLTFDWESLSGKDSVAIERELRGVNVTVVLAEFTPEYLAAMAARACGLSRSAFYKYRDSVEVFDKGAVGRNTDGFRTVNTELLYALPLREFRQICSAARRFLLRSGSGRETEGGGSGSNA